MLLKCEQELETGACGKGNRGRPCQMHPQDAQGHREEGSECTNLAQHSWKQAD